MSLRLLDTHVRGREDKPTKEALGASAYLAYSFSPSEFAGSQCGMESWVDSFAAFARTH